MSSLRLPTREPSAPSPYFDNDNPRPRSSTGSSTLRPRQRSTSNRSSMGDRRPSTVFSGSTIYSDDEEWENGEMEMGRKRKKRDEPMSPVVVVFYVTALYVIFQILTRSDEHEILSHLPAPFHSSSISLPGSSGHSDVHPHYNFPYHLPHITSPLPSSSDASPGFWRGLLGVIIYPVYLLVTLLAIPLPLLLNTIHLVLSILSTILYPLTSTARLFSKTFIVGPWGVARSILGVFYPIYTFVGGVVGVGCVMGMGAGWVGTAVLDLIYGKSKSKKKKREKGKGKERSSGKSRVESTISSDPITEGPAYLPSPSQYSRAASAPVDLHSSSSRASPLSAVSPNVNASRKPIKLDKKRVLDKLASTYRDIQHVENAGYVQGGRKSDGVRATGRETVAVGTRRRVHGLANGEMGRAR